MRSPRSAVVLAILASACSRGAREGEAPGTPRVPEARLDPGAVENVLRASRARHAALDMSGEIGILEGRFRRMNLVAMGRDPADGRPMHLVRNESPEFRRLAAALRSELGDSPVDALGERLADLGADALLDRSRRFRIPMALSSFAGEELSPQALEILALTRDLPLILIRRGLLEKGDRSALPWFTVRTLLRVRWNIETERPPRHGLDVPETIAHLEFVGRHKRWSPLPERLRALEELAALLPDYPLDRAIEALFADGAARAPVIEEE